ncbi:MAG: arsenate reductase ArsC [Dehalococcoidia bacterium]|nr:MAG: arsenate reductase ArsC [Dehalococcoidia bacterium]
MKTVLFVCVHNSSRSQMAEAFFNRLAGGKARAMSAGTQPSEAVNPVVARAMLEAGLDISRNKPKLLTSEMLDKADRVITMGCLDSASCPARLVTAEDWGLPDPEGKTLAEVIKIRDKIERRVAELLEGL